MDGPRRESSGHIALAPQEHPHQAVERLERNFLALGAGDLAARTLGFLATVYLARLLGAESYGLIALAAAIALYPKELADFGVSSLGSREVAHDPDRARSLSGAWTTLRVAVAGLAGLVMSASALAILDIPEAWLYVGFAILLLPVAANPSWILMGLERAGSVGLARASGAVVLLATTVLWVRRPEDLVWAPAALIAGECCTAMLLWVAAGRAGFRILPLWRHEAVRPLARQASPLVADGLLGLLIFNADLIFLRLLGDREAVGLYAAAFALVSLLFNLGGAYGDNLLPALTRARQAGRDAALLVTSYARLFAAGAPIAAGGALLAPDLISRFFGETYLAAAPALAVLLCCVPLSLFRSAATAALISRGGSGALFTTSAFGAVCNLTLNLLLIPRYGIIGAAVASLVTEAARVLALARATSRFGLPGPELRRLGIPAFAVSVMSVLLWLWPEGGLLPRLVLGAGTYSVVLWATGALRWNPGSAPSLRL